MAFLAKKRLIVALIIAGIVLILLGLAVFATSFIARRSAKVEMTAFKAGSFGLSRWVADGQTVSVENGFIKSSSSNRLIIRAIAPIPKIVVSTQDSDKGANLLIELENVGASDVGTPAKDVKLVKKNATTVGFHLLVPPRQRKVIPIYPIGNPYHFRFFVVGDTREGDEIFKNIIEHANKKKPLFTFHGGDLVSEGKEEEYAHLLTLINELEVPLYVTPGNHDIRSNGRPIYGAIFGPAYYSFTYGNIHFIVLDSSTGGLDDAQYGWLEEDLKNHQVETIIVFTHVPPFDPRPGESHAFNSPDERDVFLDLMKRYGVDRVYASHIHSYFREEKEGVPYVISGGGGAYLVSSGFYHYIDVEVDGGEIREKVVKIPSSPETQSRIDWEKAFAIVGFTFVFGGSAMILTSLGLGRLSYLKKISERNK